VNPLLVSFGALAGTLAIELPLAALLAPAASGGARGRCLATALCANLVTHPVALALQTELGFVPLELGVTALECALYALVAGLTPARALLLGVVANVVSASCSG